MRYRTPQIIKRNHYRFVTTPEGDTVTQLINPGAADIQINAGHHAVINHPLRECRSAGITIDNLEAKCVALAAESAGMKKFCKDAAFDADYEAELGMERGGFSDALNEIKTPATDAFLSEVRAQGVDAAIEAAKNLVAQEYEYKDFKAAQSDCCMHPGSDLVGKVEMTEWLVDFAAQLRKGE